MPPKPSKTPPGKAKGNDEAKEEPLQAVVLADTFENKFAPFTLERPRCLLPLANTPLIEYTLEFLASAGVQEVYLYAGAHVDQVETYISASRWKQLSSPFTKVAFIRCVASSVGDVMRDLDQRGILVGDFIVVSGDAVCDFPIGKALKKHKARRQKDKNAIMTMLLRETASTRPLPESVATFVIDSSRDRCLHYEETSQKSVYGLHMDPETLKSPELDIRQDLVDCRIDVCTPDVLSLWSDNFDNQAPRKDFLFGVLKDYELNGKTIHTYIVQSQYAARAADLPAYAQLSTDIINGSIQSVKVENNVFSEMQYRKERHGAAFNEGAIKSRPVDIDSNTIIGADTSIGTNSFITSSVIGHRCNIGKGASIRSSYVWDDVTIGHGTRVSNAIIGSEAFIGDNCFIEEGAMISFGVRIATGTTIPARVKVTKARKSGQNIIMTDTTLVGDGGNGYEYSEDEEDVVRGVPGLIYAQSSFADSASSLASDITEPSSPINGSRSQSFATSVSDDDSTDRFQNDTVAILLQRMQEGQKADDMLSELMGLRFSGGADESQVRKAVAAAIARRVTSQVDAGVTAADASRQTLKAYSTLIRRAQAVQAVSEQVDFLLDVQKELTRRNEGGKTLLHLTKDLYDLEIFGEEPFLSWWNDQRSSEAGMGQVRKQVKPFVEWLESAESESEEEGDDEDD